MTLMQDYVLVSGGFDPLHIGHIHLIEHASRFGKVIVAVDPDSYVATKHPVVMSQAERIALVSQLRDVHVAIASPAESGDCSSVLSFFNPGTFVVGPDKIAEELPEYSTCRRLGIRIEVARVLVKKHSSRQYHSPAQYNNPPVCCSVIVHSQQTGGVLLGKRADNGLWDIPGGFLEAGETLEQCAQRELKEEFDITPGLRSFVPFERSRMTSYNDGRLVLLVGFVCSLPSVDVVTLGPEMRDCSWITKWDPKLRMNNEGDALLLYEFFRQQRSV